MKRFQSSLGVAVIASALMTIFSGRAEAQYAQDTPSASSDSVLVLTLEDALKIALSENVSVKVADLEVERGEYARRGSYSSLLPQINGSGSFQRTIKKQVMYMGGSSDDEEESGGGMSSMFSGILEPVMYYINELIKQAPNAIPPYQAPQVEESSSGDGGFEVGRLNTFNAGISAQMPLVNFQLWENIRLAGQQTDLAVEKARESRLGTVTSVKQAFYAVLFAKEAFEVYKQVYDNAVENFQKTEKRYKVQKASELEFTRAASNVAAAVPNVYNAESGVIIALWQLKAVMGIDLDREIDVAGDLMDYAGTMFFELNEGEHASLENNTTLRQLEMQAEQLATSIRMQQYANLPSLSLGFAYSYNAMTDDFKFKDFHWTPYSYIGISLNIPIFAGGQRYYAVKQAKVQAAELDYQRINTERQLRIGIRQSLNSMETAMRTYEAANDALRSAQKAYDIAVKSYDVGRSTLTDLNDAQLILTQTRLNATQAVYNFLTAKAGLEQTLGYDFIDDKENN